MIDTSKSMRLQPIHLVLGAALVAVLGALAVLVTRALPEGEGRGWRGDRIGDRGKVAPLVTSDDRRPTKRASQPQPIDDPRTPSPASSAAPSSTPVPHYRYKVIKVYPHDRRFFTQGLVYENGFVYEGTGLYGQSAIYQRELQTGKIIKSLRLPDKYFGEGITLFGNKLIQLTWQSQVGFVYKKDTFTPLGEFKYAGEGWGLTHDGRRLILSDGTAILRFLDPNTFAETGRLEVRGEDRRVERLNELEYVDGSIYANIWPTDQIVIIDHQTGRVTGRIDLSGLYTPPENEQGDSVLNGIAYLPQTRRLLITGKLWPRMYEIELVPQP